MSRIGLHLRRALAVTSAVLALTGGVAASDRAAASTTAGDTVPTTEQPTIAMPPQLAAPSVEALADTCTTLRADLPSMAAEGLNRAACIEPAPGVTTNEAVSAQSAPAPDWCGTGGTLRYTRTESCGGLSWQLSVFDVQTGAMIGQILFNTVNYSYTSGSVATWAHQLSIDPTYMWGQVAGTTVNGYATCLTGSTCVLASSNFPSQAVLTGNINEGDSFFNTTATAPGAKGSSTTRFTFTFSNPAWAGATSGNQDQITVRCDNALPGASYGGCVFSDYVSTMVYKLSGPYPLLAQHIRDGQASGLPGAYPSGTPLRRLTDSTIQEQNRTTACPSSYPRPPGFSCDEYPFASTYQGASLSGGGPRSFPYCAVVLLTQSSGPSGYSVCMIEAGQNSGGGSALGAFYKTNRVIDFDPFRVAITT